MSRVSNATGRLMPNKPTVCLHMMEVTPHVISLDRGREVGMQPEEEA